MTESRKLRVFLCHASQDKPVVRELYHKLLAEDWIDPWLDEEKLLAGQDWDMEIEKAVENADAFVICLSENALISKGYIHKEIRKGLEVYQKTPDAHIFIIPLRFDDCKTPHLLKRFHWIDFFNGKKEKGYGVLIKSLIKVRQDTILSNKLTSPLQLQIELEETQRKIVDDFLLFLDNEDRKVEEDKKRKEEGQTRQRIEEEKKKTEAQAALEMQLEEDNDQVLLELKRKEEKRRRKIEEARKQKEEEQRIVEEKEQKELQKRLQEELKRETKQNKVKSLVLEIEEEHKNAKINAVNIGLIIGSFSSAPLLLLLYLNYYWLLVFLIPWIDGVISGFLITKRLDKSYYDFAGIGSGIPVFISAVVFFCILNPDFSSPVKMIELWLPSLISLIYVFPSTILGSLIGANLVSLIRDKS